MESSFLMILLLALGGSDGNELLDYLPSKLYWKIKGVETSAPAMLAELAPKAPRDASALIPKLGDDSFEVREKATREIRAIGPDAIPALRKAVESENAEIRNRASALIRDLSGGSRHREIRRLMAIRTLGELKARESETALQPLLKSTEPFIASYAREALAAIRGESVSTAAPAGPDRDLALLPPGCGVVGRMTWPSGKPLDYDRLLKSISAVPLPGNQTPEQTVEAAARQAVALVERIGNVRIDTVTVGVSEEIGDRTGFVVVVARGRYDLKAIRELMVQGTRLEPRKVGGVEFLPIDREFALTLPSDDLLILAGGPKGDELPLEALAAALQAGEAGKVPPKVAALAKAVDTALPLWISMRMAEAYRSEPIAAPFDTLTFSMEPKGEMQALTLKAAGKDPEAVKASVGIFEKGLEEARAEIGQAIEQVQIPQMQSFVDLLKSIAVKTEGATVTVTGTMKTEGAAVGAMLPWLVLARGESAPQPPPARVNVRPVAPAPAPAPDPAPVPPPQK